MPGKFESIRGFTEGLAPARSGGKWGYIDTLGKWVVDPQFDYALNFADGLAPVGVGGKTGYIDKRGKFVVNPQYDTVSEFSEGYAVVASDAKKWGFIDTKGRVLGDQTFLGVLEFSGGLAPVKTEDGWGFIDRTGKMVISPQFDVAEWFQNGLARVTVAGKEAYITKTGAFVVDPFPGRAGIPTHPVEEIWETPWNSTVEKPAMRFILIREGAQIRGYSFSHYARGDLMASYDLKGQAAKDGSFNMADQSGTSWKGQFVSSVLIEGVGINSSGSSAKGSPIRLRLVRDATAEEAGPLPPTSSDWNVFLSSFKDAVQRRDFGALSHMTVRRFSDEISFLVSQPPSSAQLRWARVDGALAEGVESSGSTPQGRAKREIVGGGFRIPSAAFAISVHPLALANEILEGGALRLTFIQDADGQWRWARFDYPDLG
jgi:hypothetical protein